MFFILPLGVSGLVLSDLDPHLYDGLDEILLDALLVEEPVGSGTYRIDDLPDTSPVIRRTLTVEYPEGVGYSFVWGGGQIGTPEAVIMPVREAGLVKADFVFTIYRNGISQEDILIKLGLALQSDGDYPVSGWPIEFTGAKWLLVASRVGSGVYSFYSWDELSQESLVASTGVVISCSAIHPPFDVGVDEVQRSYFSCNYALKLDGLFRFDRAFAEFLESEGFGVLDENIHYGHTVTYPTEGQVILLVPQSGFSSLKTHDNGQITRPVLQILVFDPDRNTAQAISNQIFVKLDLMANQSLPL